MNTDLKIYIPNETTSNSVGANDLYQKISSLKDIDKVKNMSFLTGQVFGVKGISAKLRNKLILGNNNYIQNFMNNIWE